jgi:CheY-like chemotaxis protein
VRELVAQTLSRHGYRVVTACDGAEAIAVFAPQASEVKLVLTDLQMPVLGGAALAMVLRRLQINLCIVAMSGSGSEADPSDCDFAAAFLVKPFQPETLLRLVHRLLHKPELLLAPAPEPQHGPESKTACLV